jgi:hypothetical protein
MSLRLHLTKNFVDTYDAPRGSLRGSLRARLRALSVGLPRVRWAARLSFALLVVLMGAQSASAMPLVEYRSRVHRAVIALDELWEGEDGETANEYAARVRIAFDKVRKLVPTEETIQWEGGRVKVDNSWFDAELKDYEQTATGVVRRAEAMERAYERLLALENRLNELIDRKESAAAGAKEQDKARLEAILRREEYGEKVPQKSLWERFKEWLNSLFPSRNPLTPGQSSWLATISMILIYSLAAAVLAYALWKLMPLLLGRWKGTQLNLEKRRARIVLGERLAPDQSGADILAEAEALARKGEIRAAIRKGYIALLCELGDRKVLSLAQHKTNHDYLRAVREKRPLLNEMQKLTASFENHWYGYVPAQPHDWTAFRSGYQQTLKTAALLSAED